MGEPVRKPEATVAASGARASTPPENPYLFADSVPFSHNFDFISALESFVDFAAAVLVEARSANALKREIERLRDKLVDHIGILDTLESQVLERATDMLFGNQDAERFLGPVAERLGNSVTELCSGGRADLKAAFEADRERLTRRIEDHQANMASAMQRFFLESVLEVSCERFTAVLRDDGYQTRLLQLTESDLVVRLELDRNQTFWSVPRRVSDLSPGLSLAVGMRRSFLSRSMGVDIRSLGDYLIGRVRREGDTIELGLRKKREQANTLFIQLTRYDDGVIGQAVHADHRDSPFDIPLEHAASMDALFRAVAERCVAPKQARIAATRVRIGKQDALDAGGAERLVDHLVAAYRPIVAQLIDHGAASFELSLKRVLGDGRREERFVTLSHLVDKVSALGSEERARLRGLGLDKEDARKEAEPMPRRIDRRSIRPSQPEHESHVNGRASSAPS